MDKMELSRKLEQLAALAASRENRLEMTEVLDAFKELQVTPEEMEDTIRESEELAEMFAEVARIIREQVIPSDWRSAGRSEGDTEAKEGGYSE